MLEGKGPMEGDSAKGQGWPSPPSSCGPIASLTPSFKLVPALLRRASLFSS